LNLGGSLPIQPWWINTAYHIYSMHCCPFKSRSLRRSNSKGDLLLTIYFEGDLLQGDLLQTAIYLKGLCCPLSCSLSYPVPCPLVPSLDRCPVLSRSVLSCRVLSSVLCPLSSVCCPLSCALSWLLCLSIIIFLNSHFGK